MERRIRGQEDCEIAVEWYWSMGIVVPATLYSPLEEASFFVISSCCGETVGGRRTEAHERTLTVSAWEDTSSPWVSCADWVSEEI